MQTHYYQMDDLHESIGLLQFVSRSHDDIPSLIYMAIDTCNNEVIIIFVVIVIIAIVINLNALHN